MIKEDVKTDGEETRPDKEKRKQKPDIKLNELKKCIPLFYTIDTKG